MKSFNIKGINDSRLSSKPIHAEIQLVAEIEIIVPTTREVINKALIKIERRLSIDGV